MAQPAPGGNGPDALLFTGQRGEVVRPPAFRARVFKLCVRDCLPAEKHALRLHDLRHTAAAGLIAAGANVKELMEILGHSSPVLSLARYGHLLDGATDALATRVGTGCSATTTDPRTSSRSHGLPPLCLLRGEHSSRPGHGKRRDRRDDSSSH